MSRYKVGAAGKEVISNSGWAPPLYLYALFRLTGGEAVGPIGLGVT